MPGLPGVWSLPLFSLADLLARLRKTCQPPGCRFQIRALLPARMAIDAKQDGDDGQGSRVARVVFLCKRIGKTTRSAHAAARLLNCMFLALL